MDVYEVREPTSDYRGLERTERPKPAIADDEVLVRIRACSLNYRDIAIAHEDLAYPRVSYPVVPLSDGAGEVVAVGDAVETLSEGARVTTPLAPDWRDGEGAMEKLSTLRGSTIDGMLAEYVAIKAEDALELPDHLSYEEAATLPCAALTAWRALVEDGGLHAGRTVLALGTGGVSTFALQFASMHGARTIVTSSSDDKLDRATSLGAWETINYERTPEWDERVLELTGGEGVDHVVEVGGPGTLDRSLNAVSPNGHVHLIGVLTGPEGDVNASPILHKIVTVEGIMGAGSRAMLARMLRAFEITEATPPVDRIFDFEAAREAFRYAASGRQFGKVVISLE